MSTKGVSLLFVCLGNICRSPAADAIALNLQNNFTFINNIDSAGTSSYHIGEPPHKTMQSVAAKRGIDMSYLRSRQVEKADFNQFDYIIAMDSDNYADLMSMKPANCRAQVVRLLDYTDDSNKNVPDPYYGGAEGFENCFDIIYRGVDKFFEFLAHKA